MARHKASLLAFFLVWAERKGWEVPAIHVRACCWLEHRGDLAVLRCFRGFGKSTLLAIYNAWRYYSDPAYRILHQSESDGTAYKTSRDTQNVLRNHPWTSGMLPDGMGTVEQWWINGAMAIDSRNASMYAKGILSNVTSARADECQNDDVEVPKNIQTPEAREKLRYRLGEQTHILVPGGRKLYIGTPHTHDSLYDEQERLGADCLTIRMFEQEYRIESAVNLSYPIPFAPDVVFFSIGEFSRRLVHSVDYQIAAGRITFAEPPKGLVDLYAGCAWPERFTLDELEKRRKKTRTINEWDSQYQLHSKPVGQVRIDPEKIIPYDAEPVILSSNKTAVMWLGKIRIVGMACHWDPASGKLKSDVSAVAMVLQDDSGRRYLHRVKRLVGEVAEFGQDGKTITGGQVFQLCDLVEEFAIPRITIETNGIGQFAPVVLKAALKQRRLQCGVSDDTSSQNKNKRILEALEPPISARMLWAHISVLDGPLWDQAKDFNPALSEQDDDYLDASAKACTSTPERIKGVPNSVRKSTGGKYHDWRPDTGVHEVTLEL